MEINRSIETVNEIFKEFPSRQRPDEEILELLKIALTHNDFQFAGRFFLQIMGTAMGKRFAPSLANIYMRRFDQQAQQAQGGRPENYNRFLDDIFFTWRHGPQQLEEFEKYINGLIPGIKINLTYKQTNIEFLDLVTYKKYNNDHTATL